MSRREVEVEYPQLTNLSKTSKSLIGLERTTRERDEIVASLILQDERSNKILHKQKIKQEIYERYDPDMSASDTDYEEGDDLIVPNLARCPRSRVIRHKYKTSAAKKQKYVISRRERQTKDVSKTTYNGTNHHIFFQEFETVATVYNEDKYFQVKKQNGKKYSILTMANQLESMDILKKVTDVENHGSIREKSAHRNYFLGIYNCLDARIKAKVFQNRCHIDNNAIRLIWWLYTNFRQIKESTADDVIGKINEINFEKDPHKDIIKLFLHVRGLHDLCNSFEIDKKLLEGKLIKELKCCSDSVEFSTLLQTQEDKYKKGEIDFDIFLDTLQRLYTTLARNNRWKWQKIPHKNNKRTRDSMENDDEGLAGFTAEKPSPAAKAVRTSPKDPDIAAYKAEHANMSNRLNQAQANLDAYRKRYGRIKNASKGGGGGRSAAKPATRTGSRRPTTIIDPPEEWEEFVKGNDPAFGKSEVGYKFGSRNYYWCTDCDRYTNHSTKNHGNNKRVRIQNARTFVCSADPEGAISDLDSHHNEANSDLNSSVEG